MPVSGNSLVIQLHVNINIINTYTHKNTTPITVVVTKSQPGTESRVKAKLT